MDPNRCYADMLIAMMDRNHEAAREHANALQAWFARGGFYPAEYSPDVVDEFVANVLRTTAASPPGDMDDGLEFSLLCFDCDAGMHIDSRAQAFDEGWVDIEFAPDLSNANYIGLCPDCRIRQFGDD